MITYNAEVPLLLSEIDPVQNNGGRHRGEHAGLQRDHGVVRPAGRLRQSVAVGDLSALAIRRR